MILLNKYFLSTAVILTLVYCNHSASATNLNSQNIEEQPVVNKNKWVTQFEHSPNTVISQIESHINEGEFENAENIISSLLPLNDVRIKKLSETLSFRKRMAAVKAWFYHSDDKASTLSTTAFADSRNLVDGRYVPQLYIQCEKGQTDMFMVVYIPTKKEPKLGNKHSVLISFDKENPIKYFWNESQKDQASILMVDNPIALIHKMATAKKMYIEFSPHNSRPITSTFGLNNFSIEIPKIAEACGWTM